MIFSLFFICAQECQSSVRFVFLSSFIAFQIVFSVFIPLFALLCVFTCFSTHSHCALCFLLDSSLARSSQSLFSANINIYKSNNNIKAQAHEMFRLGIIRF